MRTKDGHSHVDMLFIGFIYRIVSIHQMFYSSNHPFSITAAPALRVAGANLYV